MLVSRSFLKSNEKVVITVVTLEGYTFITKFQEDNCYKVLRSVDFFSIKFDEFFFVTACWGPLRSVFSLTIWGPPQINFFANYTMWGPPLDKLLHRLYGGPLKSVSLLTIEGPLRSL